MSGKARIVGINHVALEVGNIEAAPSFHSRAFSSRCADAARKWSSSIFDFKYGGGLGKGGTGILYVNDQKVGEGRIGKTQPYMFSADDTEGAGEDLATAVTEDYKEGANKFNGTIRSRWL